MVIQGLLKNKIKGQVVMVQTFNTNTWEVGASRVLRFWGQQVSGQLGLHSEDLSQKN